MMVHETVNAYVNRLMRGSAAIVGAKLVGVTYHNGRLHLILEQA